MIILLLLLSEGTFTITLMYERVNIYCAGLNSTACPGHADEKLDCVMLDML